MTPERARELLLAALTYCQGTHGLDDVLRELSAGRLWLEAGDDCLAVLEPVAYPGGRWLNVFLAAGSLTELRAREPELERRARAAGFSTLMMYVRPPRRSGAWGRVLAALGFRPAWTCFIKELN